MNKPSTFLVAVREPVAAHSAYERASLLAKSGDKIVLAHSDHKGILQLLGEGELRHGILDGKTSNSTSWLEELGSSIDANPKVTIETVLLTGEPGAAIGDYARSIGAAAIIVGAHRGGFVREIVIGSTTLRILRHAPCPVVVARNSSASEYKTAVVAVDIDAAAERVLATSRELLPQAEVNLLHVYRLKEEGKLRLRGLSETDLVPLREEVRAEAERGMAELQAMTPLANVNLEHGFPGSTILSFLLNQRPNVLVISQHRGSKLDERTLGSVTQFLLYNCPCDLILVP